MFLTLCYNCYEQRSLHIISSVCDMLYCGKIWVSLYVCMGEYCDVCVSVCACVPVCACAHVCVVACVCVCIGGKSRCRGADSSALCILKPPLPLAAKIELGGVYGWGVVVEEG